MVDEQLFQLETPCFILDEVEFCRSIRGFASALDSNFRNWTIGYSVKTNSLPLCLSLANKEGCFAEVVSYDEYRVARLCGYYPDQLIYNGPMKSEESFLEAIEGGAIVNIETKSEIQWLSKLPKDRVYNVGLRLNINISRVSPDDSDGENDNSRFGFSEETSDFVEALEQVKKLKNVRLAGLHIHRTAHSRSVRFYKNSIRYACEVILKYKLELDYLDVGGGFFGIFADKPTYKDYSDAFYEVLKTKGLEDLRVIVEPGNALVASCFSFLSEVIDVKHIEPSRWFITTDGSRNDIDPFFKKNGYMTEFLIRKESMINATEQVIAGCTCLEYDRLFTLRDSPLLSVGDRICYKNVGAYTMCLSPMFIRFIPNIYSRGNSGFNLIRGKWTANEYVLKSLY